MMPLRTVSQGCTSCHKFSVIFQVSGDNSFLQNEKMKVLAFSFILQCFPPCLRQNPMIQATFDLSSVDVFNPFPNNEL